ncbi:uncharacterized protein FMAN_11161 [Fusarium mangiferae]|uniref:C2H2-type domain-containing protein n=1 Tax=Fusarium mangiferae TaxID=192010 RepID=A0A1L7TNL2_FUSMA|nr:uncharacterized protein FMAN_11161 [Fusarium mangiferae]CVK96841.1 uncharacterized protein FMAN_11161 [Fusarium mangiferae]
MKIGPKSYAFEPERTLAVSNDSSRTDPPIAYPAKDEDGVPKPSIPDDQPADWQFKHPLRSLSSLTTSQNQHEHFDHVQRESSTLYQLCESHQPVSGPWSHTESWQETSGAISPPKTELLDDANLWPINETELGMLEGAKTKRILLPKSTCWGQPPAAQPQKEGNCSDSKATTMSSKRRAAENKDPQKKSRTAPSTNKDRSIEAFACPYYRKYPERYFDCINLRLNRISDVKQHLKRRHTWNYTCSRCSRGFSLQKAYEEHFLRQECPIKDCTNHGSVSPRAQEILRYRVDRRSSPERQWHEICRILFGRLGNALNPHHDGIFKEVTGIIRGIWRAEEQNIISSLSGTLNVPGADELRPLLSHILSRVEGYFEQKEQTVAEESLKEPVEKLQDTGKAFSQRENPGHACQSPKVGSSEILNTGSIKAPEPVGPPTQEWQLSNDIESSSMSNYSFTCLTPTQHQNQFEYSYPDHSAGGLHSDLGMDWHLGDLGSDISMGDFMSFNSSMEESLPSEDYKSSTQKLNGF